MSRFGRGFPLSTRVLQKPRLTPTKPQGTHGILRLPGRASRLADRAIKGIERGLGQTFISDVFLPYNLSPSLVYRTEVAADQPLRWWHLDDTSGTTAVESVGGNSGTYAGSPTFGDVGLASDAPRATQFVAASSQEVTLPTTNLAPSGVGTWSLEISFKWPSGGNTVLMRDNTSASGTGWIVYTVAGFLTVRAAGSDIATSIVDTAARDGKKHLLHVVMTNRAVKIYYDGSLVGSGTAGSNNVVTPWHFGKNGTNAGQYTNCTGGDLILYARELTAERVTAHYNAWVGAAPGVTQTASASLSGSANLSTTAQVTRNASASPSGSGTLTGSAQVAHLATSSLSGSGTLAVAALVDHRAASSLSGSGTLTGSADLQQGASASLSGSATVNPVATLVDHRASASLDGSGTLTCATQVTHPAASSLSGTGALSATAGNILSATPPVLAGVSNLSATVQATRNASAALSGNATLACETTVVSGSRASLTGSAALAALARIEHRGAGSLSGSAALAMVTTVEMHPRGLMVSELHTDFHANAIYSATVAGNILSGSLHVDETLVLGVFDQNYTLLRMVTTDERRLDAQGGVLSEVAIDWSEAISAETDINLIHVHDPEHGATDINLRPLSVDRTIEGTDVSLSLDGDHQTLRVTDEQIVVV